MNALRFSHFDGVARQPVAKWEWCARWLVRLNPVWLSLTLALVALLLSGVMCLRADRQQAQQRELALLDIRERADQTSAALTQVLEQPFRRITALQDLAAKISLSIEQGQPDQEVLLRARLNEALGFVGPAITQVAGADRSGRVLWSNLPVSQPPPDLSDREHIKAILELGAEHFISKPVIGRVSQQSTIQFSAAVRNAAGILMGAVVVSVDATLLHRVAAGINLETQDRVGLVRADGVLLMSGDGRRDISRAAVNRSILAEAQRTGVASRVAASVVDGRERAWSVRRIGDSGLLMAVGVDTAQAMAHTEQIIALGHTTLIALIASIIACLALAGCALLLLRTMLARRIIRQALANSERRRSNLLRVAPGLLFCGHWHAGQLQVLEVEGEISAAVEGYVDTRPALDVLNAAIDTLHPADMGDFAARLRDGLTATVDLPLEMPGSPDDDLTQTRWLRLFLRVSNVVYESGRAFPLEEGEELPLVGFAVDVTAERDAQMVMNETSRLLTLGEMASGLAHEMSQPLASITLAAENARLMLDKADPNIAKLIEKIDRIAAQALRAGKVVDHMRVFSHASPPSRGRTSLPDVVANASDMLALRLRSAGVELKVALEADLPLILSEPIPLEQVILNLISNALDAYGAGGATHRVIEITAQRSGDMVLLEIADHAGGIPEALLGRIFEPFVTTKSAGSGTGLGLSICRAIIEKIKGRLHVANRGDGAVFFIALPAWVSGYVPDTQADQVDLEIDRVD